MQVARVAVMHEVQDKNSNAQESNGAWLGQTHNDWNLKPKGFSESIQQLQGAVY